jgi:peptide/nickel transport system substrate-binding protein
VTGTHFLATIRFRAWAVILGAALLAAACGTTLTSIRSVRASASVGTGTVRFADVFGSPANYIFPLDNGPEDTNTNYTYMQPEMWRPLYWFGHNNSSAPSVNYALSLAYPPQYSANGETVTINLRHYLWSDGVPVTSRDVIFWINILVANHANWANWAPGDWSTHIVGLAAPTATQVQITFNVAFNRTYLLYNGLSQIIPIPQHSWDKISATSPVGSYDMTTAGAVSVYNYLNAQSEDLGTWDTNPLWQVVDGPFHLKPNDGYYSSTGYAVLIANGRYSGPSSPNRINTLILEPYTSPQAEVDALLSGQLDYGALPYSDLSLIKTLGKKGFRVQTWQFWGFTFMMLDYANPKTGPIFRQLYIRKAMQELINEGQYIKEIFHGYGTPVNGPAPVVPTSNLASPATIKALYPYDVASAKALLKDHGWSGVSSGGTARCERPGDGSTDCGAGIARGATLTFVLRYENSLLQYTEEVEALESSFASVGIHLTAIGGTPGQTSGPTSSCVPSTGVGCGWDMNYLASPTITYVPTYYPSGEILFATGAAINWGNYSSPTMDALISASHIEPGLGALYKYEKYVAQQLPALWLPNSPYQISVIRNKIKGIPGQDPTNHIYPEFWTVSN